MAWIGCFLCGESPEGLGCSREHGRARGTHTAPLGAVNVSPVPEKQKPENKHNANSFCGMTSLPWLFPENVERA